MWAVAFLITGTFGGGDRMGAASLGGNCTKGWGSEWYPRLRPYTGMTWRAAGNNDPYWGQGEFYLEYGAIPPLPSPCRRDTSRGQTGSGLD